MHSYKFERHYPAFQQQQAWAQQNMTDQPMTTHSQLIKLQDATLFESC